MLISPSIFASVKVRLAVLSVSVFSAGALFSSPLGGNTGSVIPQRPVALHHAKHTSGAGSNAGRNDTANDTYDSSDEYSDCDYYDDGYNDDGYEDGYYDDRYGTYDDGYGTYDDGYGACEVPDDTSASGPSDAPYDGLPDSTAGGSTLLHTFNVVSGAIDARGASATETRAAKAIWSRFTKLIPADRRSMVTAFELRSRKYNGAYVYLDDPSSNAWVLGVQVGLNDGYELDSMLVHEFGHLLTLNSGQIQLGSSPRKCVTYYFGEGCAKPESIGARFLAQFWSNDMRRIADSDDNYLADDYPGSFVTDYAATNPAEDLAETFATFVMNGKPTRNRIADAKVNFFWGLPDLVQLRAQIRSNQA